MSSRTRMSSGPMPCIGEIAPPSTWYRPRITPLRSRTETSLGSSTTQIVSASREGSAQSLQSSLSATPKHSRQKRIRSLACTIAPASRLASCSADFTMWKASRCADFGPMPGRRFSSSTRSWIGPSYT
jgi:hypothetical protein